MRAIMSHDVVDSNSSLRLSRTDDMESSDSQGSDMVQVPTLPESAKKKGAKEKRVKLSLEVSLDVNQRLENLAEEIDGTKSEVLRRALVLMEVVVDARKRGKKVGFADRAEQLTTQIIGF